MTTDMTNGVDSAPSEDALTAYAGLLTALR